MADADVKPDVKSNTGSSDVLNLVIRDAQGDEVHFKVKPTTKFEKIFNAWKTRKAVQTGVRFMVDGVQLHEHRTPDRREWVRSNAQKLQQEGIYSGGLSAVKERCEDIAEAKGVNARRQWKEHPTTAASNVQGCRLQQGHAAGVADTEVIAPPQL